MNEGGVPQSQSGNPAKRPLWSRLANRDIKKPIWRKSKPAKTRVDGDSFVEEQDEAEQPYPEAAGEPTGESAGDLEDPQ